MKVEKKAWTPPVISSVERLKNAAGGTNSGFSKDGTITEYLYAGPGS